MLSYRAVIVLEVRAIAVQEWQPTEILVATATLQNLHVHHLTAQQPVRLCPLLTQGHMPQQQYSDQAG